MRKPLGSLGTGVLFLVLFAAGLAAAQDDEEKPDFEKELEALKERVAALEDVLEQKGPSTDGEWRIFWSRGLNFEQSDGAFSLEISGKVQVEAGFLSGDRAVDDELAARGEDLEDQVSFRRARLTLSGRVYERFFYKAAYEFSEGDADFKDVFLGMDGLPYDSRIVVGHFREPFSLEMVTAEEGLRFMERSIVSVLAPSRNTGAGWLGTLFDERMSWGIGAFYPADSYGEGGGDGDLCATARITGLPWYGGADRLVHLGAAYSRRAEDELAFEAQPEVFTAPDFIATPDFEVSGADLLGGESALVAGPFSAQGEYVRMNIDARQGRDPTAWGYYLAGAYSLTGEPRPYDRNLGRFGRITPEAPFLDGEGGPGAWEIATRYSRLDLDDEGIPGGGELTDYTVGVNWYLNDAVSVMSNYVHSHLEGVGSARMLALRFGIVF